MKRRYYIDAFGYDLVFTTNNIVQAIFSADNYNGDLWEVPIGTTLGQCRKRFASINPRTLVFSGCDRYCGIDEKYGVEIISTEYEEDDFGDLEPSGFMIVRDLISRKEYGYDDIELLELKYN